MTVVCAENRALPRTPDVPTKCGVTNMANKYAAISRVSALKSIFQVSSNVPLWECLAFLGVRFRENSSREQRVSAEQGTDHCFLKKSDEQTTGISSCSAARTWSRRNHPSLGRGRGQYTEDRPSIDEMSLLPTFSARITQQSEAA